jgi:hypothetical protein
MYSSVLIYKPSPSVFIKTWIIDRLESLHGSLYRYLVNDIVTYFEKSTLVWKTKLDRVDSLSPSSAQYKLIDLKPILQSFERLDEAISEMENHQIKIAFKELKKIVYKYEARLHRMATSEIEVEETPDSVKIMLSSFKKNIAV